MDHAELINIKIAASGAAFEVGLTGFHHRRPVVVRVPEVLSHEFSDVFVELHVFFAEFKLACAVMEQKNARGKTMIDGEMDDFENFLGRSRSDDAAHDDFEFGQTADDFEFIAKPVEDLDRDIVGLDSVHADLEMLKTGIVEFIDDFFSKERGVRYHLDRRHADFPGIAYQIEYFGVEQRLAAAEFDGQSAQSLEFVDARTKHVCGDWIRAVIEFVAVTAFEVAAARDDELRKEG